MNSGGHCTVHTVRLPYLGNPAAVFLFHPSLHKPPVLFLLLLLRLQRDGQLLQAIVLLLATAATQRMVPAVLRLGGGLSGTGRYGPQSEGQDKTKHKKKNGRERGKQMEDGAGGRDAEFADFPATIFAM